MTFLPFSSSSSSSSSIANPVFRFGSFVGGRLLGAGCRIGHFLVGPGHWEGRRFAANSFGRGCSFGGKCRFGFSSFDGPGKVPRTGQGGPPGQPGAPEGQTRYTDVAMSTAEMLEMSPPPILPFAGILIGTCLNLLYRYKRSAGTKAERKKLHQDVRLGFGVAAAVGFALVAVQLRRVPQSNRLRSEVSWPWTDRNNEEALPPIMEMILGFFVLPSDHPLMKWATGVFARLREGNPEVPGFQDNWTIKVFDLPMLNAFVNPARRDIWMSRLYVALMEHESHLAFVLGHELGHSICGHTKDWFIFSTLTDVFLVVTGFYVGWIYGGGILTAYAKTASRALGRFTRFVGFVFVFSLAIPCAVTLAFILPYRRKMETEADLVGFKFTAKACFDMVPVPQQFELTLFQGHQGPPGWKSTHPTDGTRVKYLRQLVPWGKAVGWANGCGAPAETN